MAPNRCHQHGSFVTFVASLPFCSSRAFPLASIAPSLQHGHVAASSIHTTDYNFAQRQCARHRGLLSCAGEVVAAPSIGQDTIAISGRLSVPRQLLRGALVAPRDAAGVEKMGSQQNVDAVAIHVAINLSHWLLPERIHHAPQASSSTHPRLPRRVCTASRAE